MPKKDSNKMFYASFWMLIAKWIEKILGIISILILARLLSPDDYGVAALAQIIVVTFQIVLADGTEAYLIRKDSINKEDYNTAWTVRVCLFLFIGVVIYTFKVDISTFLGEPRLTDVLIVSSLTTIVSGFTSVAFIKASRDLNYKPIFLLNVFKKLLAFIVTVIVALEYKNYWALVFGFMTMQVSNVVLSYIFFSYRPVFTFVKIREQFDFTKWLMLGNITSFIRNKYTDLLLPKYMGVGVLGQYNMAYQIANMVNGYIVEPINNPVLSSYSKVKEDKKELSSQFIKVVGILSTIMMPCYIGQYILSKEIILIVLGSNWLNISYIFEIFLGFIVTQSYIGSIITVLTVIGKVKLVSFLQWLILFILLPVITYAIVYESIEVVIIDRLKISLIGLLIFFIALYRNVWLDWKSFVLCVLRPAIATLGMAILLYYIHVVLPTDYINIFLPVQVESELLIIIFEIIISALCYIFLLLSIWMITGQKIGGEKFVIDKIKFIYQ